MTFSLSNLRRLAALALLAAIPRITEAQLTTAEIGTLHNEILGKYFSAGNAMVSPSNYNDQLPIAVNFVCGELSKKGYTGKGCSNPMTGVSMARQMAAERYGSSSSAFFDSKIALITAKFPITPDQQSMVGDLRNILCTPGPLTMKQTMIAALKNRFMGSAPTGIFKEWFGGAIAIAESSCAFWGSPGNPSGGNDPLGFLIGDAVGFLIGWADQAIDDAGSGNLTPAGENNRLAHAAWGAVIGSVLGP